MSSVLTVTLNPAIDLSSEAETVQHTFKVRTDNARYEAGGGGINVARATKELGGDVEALFVAGGEAGAMLDRLLGEQGIKRRSVPIDGQTRINFTVWEKSTGLEYRFLTKGPAVRPEQLEPCLDVVAKHDGEYVVASGSLPVGAPTDIYARMAEFAAARGARFVIDSSGEGLRQTLERGGVFLVKPSRGELEKLVGRELDEDGIRRAAAELVDRGAAELVAVTLGRDGAFLASADGILRVPAIDVEVRSAVGAGDSFLAAMILALLQGKMVEDAFRYGMAAGAAAAMTPGTQLCRREDVEALYRGHAT